MRQLTILLMAACTVGLTAAEKPARLTPADAREGWLLLFDGETPFGWHSEVPPAVEKGALIVGGPKTASAWCTTRFTAFDLRVTAEGAGELILRDGAREQATRIAPGAPASLRVEQNGKVPMAIGFRTAAGERLAVSAVRLRPRTPVSLFDGESLAGWKEHPGKKSKYSVTKDGWLEVKDGPGDLQTRDQYDDFVVQLECLSHGKHLNSGLFFRCLPGEYQQGYEAQIRNQWNEAADQKYKVEDHDPKTNKLLGTREVMSPAVDYGTGAIYRRVPARRVPARDGEWFTLTVVADGRHLATWVNGVQAADWDDNRPPADNARKGYKSGAGALSLQGHDPTTHLSFRNLRLGELRPK